jgi:hypothetical protein
VAARARPSASRRRPPMIKRRKEEEIAGVLEFEGRTGEDSEVKAWLAEHKAQKGARFG